MSGGPTIIANGKICTDFVLTDTTWGEYDLGSGDSAGLNANSIFLPQGDSYASVSDIFMTASEDGNEIWMERIQAAMSMDYDDEQQEILAEMCQMEFDFNEY